MLFHSKISKQKRSISTIEVVGTDTYEIYSALGLGTLENDRRIPFDNVASYIYFS